MNKRRRAFESMILTWVFILGIPTLLIAILIFAKGGFIGNYSSNNSMISIANDLATLVLSIIELCAIAIVIVGVHYYFRYYRRSVFIFKGFNNAPKLADIGQVPIDFNNLAQEELAYQFHLVYGNLKKRYAKSNDGENASDFTQQATDPLEESDNSHISLSELYAEETRTEDKEEWPLPREDIMRGILDARKAQRLVDYLKKTINSMKTGDLSDLVDAIKDAPQGIGPITSLMDVIFPAPTITVTCHLQWRGDCSDEIGITFEVNGYKKNGGVSFTQTLWSNKTNSTREGKKLAESYIELLKPAMRWLVLLWWELEILDVPYNDQKGFLGLFHRLATAVGLYHDDRENLRQALRYLLGILCYVSADHFPECSTFFDQQAIRRLSRVASKFPKLSLSNFIRAEMYRWKADNEVKKNECGYSLYQQAIDYYKRALDDLELENQENREDRKDFKNWITIRRALAVGRLNNDKQTEDTIGEINSRIEEGKEGDPTTFYSEDGREECSLYLSNLACWYADLIRWYNGNYWQEEKEAKRNATKYLIYSFVRHPRPWYDEEQEERWYKKFDDFFIELPGCCLFDEHELARLREVLKEKRLEISVLATQKKGAFSHGVETLFGSLVEQAPTKEAKTKCEQYEYAK